MYARVCGWQTCSRICQVEQHGWLEFRKKTEVDLERPLANTRRCRGPEDLSSFTRAGACWRS